MSFLAFMFLISAPGVVVCALACGLSAYLNHREIRSIRAELAK